MLNGPDMFRCEKYSCTLRKAVCMERQARAGPAGRVLNYYGLGRTEFVAHKFQGCVSCGQGAAIAKEVTGMGIMKVCIRCGEKKALEDFTKHATSLDGRENICRICRAAHSREAYRKKHPEAKIKVQEPKIPFEFPEKAIPANQAPPTVTPVAREEHIPLVDISEVKALVDAHWKYIGNLLTAHGIVGVELIEYHYRTAFIHGFKHGVERVMEVLQP